MFMTKKRQMESGFIVAPIIPECGIKNTSPNPSASGGGLNRKPALALPLFACRGALVLLSPSSLAEGA